MTDQTDQRPAVETVPVLIIGAGLGGLSAATFLSLHGVPAVVVERHNGLSVQPKARGQSPITMEALRTVGLHDAILAATPAGNEGQFVVFAKSMAGPVFANLPAGQVDMSPFSPAAIGGASQERTERILAARATELGADIRFHRELVSFEQDGAGVTAQIRNVETGEQRALRALYMISADGHRAGIRQAIGIDTHGRQTRRPSATLFIQFEADLDEYTHRTAYGFYVLKNPDLPRGQVTLTTTDYEHRYVLGVTFDRRVEPGEAGDDNERIREVIETACGVPGLEFTVLDKSWTTPGVHVTRIADAFRQGRIFLVGDTAHQMPPSGGMGGNTAILDGYNLAWKLAAVLRGSAGLGLLDSYDAERRPFGDMMAEQQFANLARRHVPELLDDTVAKELHPATQMFGFVCPAGAFVRDAQDDVNEADGQDVLFEKPRKPSGRPGTRAAHVALVSPTRDGAVVSTRDLFQTRFVVLTQSANWASAATEAGRRLALPLDVYLIGGSSSGPFSLEDPEGRFPRAYGITEAGLVLVRPDGIIGWRSAGSGSADDLEGALRVILDRGQPIIVRPSSGRQLAEAVR